ncbi:hypothetical protein SeMB42_g05883 [Synchytrium endobioticum]|uniref:Uncharacterized protein n=1 Tax=Synchytrium endobioticum TaxID=286115 RepID=A0A507CNP7_9FUNG|nr:hypothetical protein SeMB42_g05883 [Synchytrium endobioticum]
MQRVTAFVPARTVISYEEFRSYSLAQRVSSSTITDVARTSLETGQTVSKSYSNIQHMTPAPHHHQQRPRPRTHTINDERAATNVPRNTVLVAATNPRIWFRNSRETSTDQDIRKEQEAAIWEATVQVVNSLLHAAPSSIARDKAHRLVTYLLRHNNRRSRKSLRQAKPRTRYTME